MPQPDQEVPELGGGQLEGGHLDEALDRPDQRLQRVSVSATAIHIPVV